MSTETMETTIAADVSAILGLCDDNSRDVAPIVEDIRARARAIMATLNQGDATPDTPEEEEPEGEARRAFAVRFIRQSINSDAYRIHLWADSPEAALERFKEWRGGLIANLEPEEEESEHHVRDYGVVDGHGDPEIEEGFEPEEIDPAIMPRAVA